MCTLLRIGLCIHPSKPLLGRASVGTVEAGAAHCIGHCILLGWTNATFDYAIWPTEKIKHDSFILRSIAIFWV
jgi:hypothetical protein